MEGLTVGRIVHYVLESGRSKGQHRPAIVVRDWSQSNSSYPDGTVNCQVFVDGSNDEFKEHVKVESMGSEVLWGSVSANAMWRTSIHYSETKEPGTWHWPERA